MKRLTAWIAISLLMTISLYAAGIIAIKASDYENVVTRTVITLDSPVEPDIQSNPDQKIIRINLPGISPGSIKPDYRRLSTIIDAIEVSPVASGSNITIKTMEPFKLEQLILPDPQRIVLDIYAQPSKPGRTDRLILARFQTDTGRYSKAERELRSLARDCSNDHEIIYYWGALLIKRKSYEFASEKLTSIPSGSSFYAPAQKLLQEIPGDQSKAAAAPAAIRTPEKPAPDTLPAQESQCAKIKAVPSHSRIEGETLLTRIAEVTYDNLIISLLVFIILMIILTWLGMLHLARRQPPPRSDRDDEEDQTLFLDAKTRKQMVTKLLSDGWTVREIARELKLSVKDVEQIVKICQMSGHDEH